MIVWSSQGPVHTLIADALEVALSPARIRWVSHRPGGRDCPYCRQSVGSFREAPVIRCPACESLHRAECWKEHGGCSMFRCRRAPREGSRVEPPPDDGASSTGAPILIHLRERA